MGKNSIKKQERIKLKQIRNPEVGEGIEIGDFTIYDSPISSDKIWIEHLSGEGGEFSNADFGKVVEKFYADNF